MKILVTGAGGFIGKNLVASLQCSGYNDLYLFDVDTPKEKLERYTKDCEFIFHLAGVNRPKIESEFMEGNFGFTTELLDSLITNGNKSPIVISSSIQAAFDNPYGKSKKAGEELLIKYSQQNDVPIYIYRLPNVFGKWARPNYNSVIATFCYNIANGLSITVNDRNADLSLVYIDDVVKSLLSLLLKKASVSKLFYSIETVYNRKLGEIVDILHSFKETRLNFTLPNIGDFFVKNLYSTFLSYLPEKDFAYNLTTHEDERGLFAEMLRTISSGQISINVSKPGIVKGNHWHHTKIEKFLVVKGTASIALRHLLHGEAVEYIVSDKQLKVVDIPPGYTHSIENIGEDELIIVIWANECFDVENADTYFLEV